MHVATSVFMQYFRKHVPYGVMLNVAAVPRIDLIVFWVEVFLALQVVRQEKKRIHCWTIVSIYSRGASGLQTETSSSLARNLCSFL